MPNNGVGLVAWWSGQAKFPCVSVGGLSAVEDELVAFITGPRDRAGLTGDCGGASLVEQWGKAEQVISKVFVLEGVGLNRERSVGCLRRRGR